FGRTPPDAGFSVRRAETGFGLDGDPASSDRPRGGADDRGVTVLTGTGGCGKTHLAAAYLAGLGLAGDSGPEVWIDGSSKWTIMAGYAATACEAGLSY